MTLQLETLRDMLIETGVSADKAGDVAAEIVEHANRLANPPPRITVLTWLVAANIFLNVFVISSLFGMWSKLGEVYDQVAQIKLAVSR